MASFIDRLSLDPFDYLNIPNLNLFNMESVQSRLMYRYMRMVKYVIVNRGKHKDIAFLRKAMSMGSVRMKMPHDIKEEHIHIGDMKATWFKPYRGSRTKVLLYFHGGGYGAGSPATHRSLTSRIAQAADVCALSIDYRLAPENPFPAALDDALDAYRFLLDEGFEADHIVLGGDSAGGGLAISALIAIRDDKQLPSPAAAVCLSPWTDLTAPSKEMLKKDEVDPMLKASEMEIWGDNYAGEVGVDHPLVSPTYAELEGLPPMLIQVGTNEVLEGQVRHFAKIATDAGNQVQLQVWQNMVHVWQFFWPIIPEGEKAIEEMGAYIKKILP